MRTTLASIAAGILIGLIGCSGGPAPVVPQVGDVRQTAEQTAAPDSMFRFLPASQPDRYLAGIAASQLSDEERETAKQIRNRLPHGPADPVYLEPTIGQAGAELAIVPAGGFNIRTWPTRTVTYPRGQIVHPPLWFEEPAETTQSKGLGDDICETLYSPIRFAINLVGLPASAVVHTICEPTVTDATPVFPPYMHVSDSAPQPAGATSRPN